jgi:hypothetical protein
MSFTWVILKLKNNKLILNFLILDSTRISLINYSFFFDMSTQEKEEEGFELVTFAS